MTEEHAHDIIQLVRELEAERLAHQETRGTVAALKQECESQRAWINRITDNTNSAEAARVRLSDTEADLQRLRDGLATLEQEMGVEYGIGTYGRRWVMRLQSLLTQTHGDK